MGSAAAAISSSLVQERQRELITSCTLLWKELSDHFSFMERDLQLWSESLRSKRQSLDLSTQLSLASFHRRELSIDSAVHLALAKVEERRDAALLALSSRASPVDNNNDTNDLPGKLRSFCTRMDSDAFRDLVVSKRKEVELLRSELPLALADSIDPAKFVMDAISKVFPVDRRPPVGAAAAKSPNDLGWACVLILESLVPVLADSSHHPSPWSLPQISFQTSNGGGSTSSRRVKIGHRLTSSAVDESAVYGRDGDREKLVHLLVDTRGEKEVIVVPVVGMGGLGSMETRKQER